MAGSTRRARSIKARLEDLGDRLDRLERDVGQLITRVHDLANPVSTLVMDVHHLKKTVATLEKRP